MNVEVWEVERRGEEERMPETFAEQTNGEIQLKAYLYLYDWKIRLKDRARPVIRCNIRCNNRYNNRTDAVIGGKDASLDTGRLQPPVDPSIDQHFPEALDRRELGLAVDRE